MSTKYWNTPLYNQRKSNIRYENEYLDNPKTLTMIRISSYGKSLNNNNSYYYRDIKARENTLDTKLIRSSSYGAEKDKDMNIIMKQKYEEEVAKRTRVSSYGKLKEMECNYYKFDNKNTVDTIKNLNLRRESSFVEEKAKAVSNYFSDEADKQYNTFNSIIQPNTL